MRFYAVAGLGLIIAATSPAQQQPKTAAVIPGSNYVLMSPGCPGQLVAQQQATGGVMIWTTSLEDQQIASDNVSKPHGLGIHVDFSGSKTAVKQLELRVSYLPLGLHRMQVAPAVTSASAKSTAELDKTFNIGREASMRVGGDLLVGPAATITRVHLVSATFADGAVWHAPSEDACSVVPNRVMLVAHR